MLRRSVPSAAVIALVLAGLTACSSQSSDAADCSSTLQPGSLSDAVEVSGDFGEMPEVTIPDDVEILSSQRTFVTETEDREDAIGDDTLVGVNMAFYDASSGEAIYSSPAFTGQATSAEYLLVSGDEEASNPLTEAVRCTVPGDRVTIALSPEESTALLTQLGSSSDSLVVGVFDIASASPLRSEGATRGLPSGYPAVVTNDEGRPGIVLPPREAPEKTSSASRIVGDGAEVTAEDGVIAQVLSVGWDGSIETNTWESGPTGLGTEEQIEQSGNTFRTELTGKTVGSQVVVVENAESGARVVVVDILAVN